MPELDKRNITPDMGLLMQIFPGIPPERLKLTIIQHDWFKCIFKVEISDYMDFPNGPLVVRLEPLEEGKLDGYKAIAMTQNLAATVITEYVPKHWTNGAARDEEGREFVYSVQDFVEGQTLEDAWYGMDGESRAFVMAEIHHVVTKLYSVKMLVPTTQVLAQMTLGEEAWKEFSEAKFGGAAWGYLKDGHYLLRMIMKRFDCNQVRLYYRTIETWEDEAVLCHNDLTPRNIIVKRCHPNKVPSSYRLAAVLDWEMAGFFPPAFELALQDTFLGTANLNVSYYLALKQNLKHLVPRTVSQVQLVKTLRAMHEAQMEDMAVRGNIGATVRGRLLRRLELEMHEDPYVGWAPKQIGLSPKEAQELEDEVITEVRGSTLESRVIRQALGSL